MAFVSIKNVLAQAGLAAPKQFEEWSKAWRVAPALHACIEKFRLMQDYARAVSEHNRMQSAQVAAVLRGEDFPFEEEIGQASDRRENAKYAILAHRQHHGC